MKKTNAKKSDKKYGLPSNIIYMAKEFNKYDKKYLPISFLTTPLGAISSVIMAYLPKLIIDCITESKAPSVLVSMIIALSSAVIIIEFIKNTAVNYLYKIVPMSMRRTHFVAILMDKLMDMDYMKYMSGDIKVKKEKALTSVNNWQGNISNYLYNIIHTFASFLGFSAFTAIICRVSWLFIPLIIGTYLLSFAGWKLLQNYKDKIKDQESATFHKADYLTFNAKDYIKAKDIRLYALDGFLSHKLDSVMDEIKVFNTKKNNGHFFNVLFEDILKFAVAVIAYLYLIKLKLASDMTIGDFSLYFGAITGFAVWLTQMVDGITEIIEADHKVNDFRNFIDIKNEQNNIPQTSLPDGKCSIELTDVSFKYNPDEDCVLKNISLKIKKGEKIAVVGVNGAGKSTLVKLICGLLIPSDGEIRVNGTEISQYGRDEYYKLFSTVFQDVSLLPSTIAKNIALCQENRIDYDKLKRCMDLAGILDKVNSLPNKEQTLLIPEIHDGAVELSGGEQQRLLLARALYKDSQILILDEPTAALDPIAENNLYIKYNEFCKNKTSVYISHRLSSTRFCDKIYLIGDGKILESGSHDELIAKNGVYAEMFNVQSKYYKEEVEM